MSKLERYFNDLSGKGEIVSIIDTDIDFYHPLFYDSDIPVTFNQPLANHRKLVYYGFKSDLNNWINTIKDTEHGTHVAGTVAGKDMCSYDNHDLYDGNAPDAKILYVGDLNEVSASQLLDLMITYDSKISSNSWGSEDGFSDFNNYIYGKTSYNTPDRLFIFAAGNEYDKSGNFTVCDPGGSKNVLTVGALDSFYEQFHRYLLHITDDQSVNINMYSLIKPPPYFSGVVGQTLSCFPATYEKATCELLNQPIITLIFANSGCELNWVLSCSLSESAGILTLIQSSICLVIYL